MSWFCGKQYMVFRKLWQFISGMRFAVVLLVLILLWAVWGSLIPQGKAAAFYVHHLPRTGALITGLGLDHAYSAAIFQILVILLGLSLLVCSIRQVTRLTRTGFNYRLSGSVLVHLSLLIILAGALATGTGYSGALTISRGNRADRMANTRNRTATVLPFTVELMDFVIDTGPGGGRTISNYRSSVILRSKEKTLTAMISMNQPLEFMGHTLAQSGYHPEYTPALVLVPPHSSGKPETLTVRAPVPVPGTGYRVQLAGFYPDFVLRGQTPGTRSHQLLNPFVHLELQREGRPAGELYYSVRFNKLIPRSRWAQAFRASGILDSLRVADCAVTPGYISILSVTRDPGTGLFYTGGLGLFLGLIAVFFTPRGGSTQRSNG